MNVGNLRELLRRIEGRNENLETELNRILSRNATTMADEVTTRLNVALSELEKAMAAIAIIDEQFYECTIIADLE